MKGSQLITLDFLKAHGACAEGRREFERVFPDGGEYQQVLDRCADEDRMDFAQWLMKVCGPSDDVRTFDDDIDEPDKNIAFAGTVQFKRVARAKSMLAGCGIEAGWGIKAGGRIEAGKGYGIFSGLAVKIADWPQFAVVTAKTKPDNLISGHWKELESC